MSYIDDLEPIIIAINENRPIILFVGQSFWDNDRKVDSVLKSAFQRAELDDKNFNTINYQQLIAAPIEETLYSWMDVKFQGRIEPEWFTPISQLPLNAIFTSSIDSSLPRLFRQNGRETEIILSPDFNPLSPRSQRNLHITYLYGKTGETKKNEAPPSDKKLLRRRQFQQANILLQRLTDTVTPLGIILIDGYCPSSDWLSPEMLEAVIDQLSPKQVYLFGCDSVDLENEIIKGLVGQQLLIPIQKRLSKTLVELELDHQINLSARRFNTENTLSIGDNFMELSVAMRLKVSSAADIVTDEWLEPLPQLGKDAESFEFEHIHSHMETGKVCAEGIKRNFFIERGFEKKLLKTVSDKLKTAGQEKQVILLRGQSATGKSIALTRLALRIRESKQVPVLMTFRNSRLPTAGELEDFCLKAEETGAEATLLICDANLPNRRYNELLGQFTSRGRKVLIVGSTYHIQQDTTATMSKDYGCLFVDASSDLSKSEQSDLKRLLQEKVGITYENNNSALLLPAVYYMLPYARNSLSTGLSMEAKTSEDSIRQRGNKKRQLPSATSQISEQLINLGLIEPKNIIDSQLNRFLGEVNDNAATAINFVIVAGKFDCNIPIALLMRSISSSTHPKDIVELFDGIDLFRWTKNEDGEIYIHPRLRLEAEMLCERRLGTSNAELEFALLLIQHSNPVSSFDTNNPEKRFLLDLLQQLGPDGRYKRRYAKGYLKIAEALTKLRESKSIIDPSLVLQESYLRRHALRNTGEEAISLENEDRFKILEQAKDAVELALEKFVNQPGHGIKKMCTLLKVERAAIYGFIAVQQLNFCDDPDSVWSYYKTARESALAAISASDAYFAFDINIWIPDDLLKRGSWSPERTVELIADIKDGMERVDVEQLDTDQRSKYDERRFKVGTTLGDNSLKEDSLKALKAQGSSAAIYLEAINIGGHFTDPLSTESLEKTKKVVSFIDEHYDAARKDLRCLRYYLKTMWSMSTGSLPFGNEKSPIPTDENDIRKLLEVIGYIYSIEGDDGDPKIQYLQALLLWITGQVSHAQDIWRQLDRNTMYSDPRRVIKHHIWSNTDGQPRIFYGRVSTNVSNNISPARKKVKVKVEGYDSEIELLQRDFPDVDLSRGINIPGGFHIAFNFIGPIAEPLQRKGRGI